jgi:hypothetical protein
LGWVDSLICIGSPVRGLRPVDALRLEQENVPKPTRRTSSPFFSAPLIVSNTHSTARVASLLLRPVASATELMSSCLFIVAEPLFKRLAANAEAASQTGSVRESKGKREFHWNFTLFP